MRPLSAHANSLSQDHLYCCLTSNVSCWILKQKGHHSWSQPEATRDDTRARTGSSNFWVGDEVMNYTLLACHDLVSVHIFLVLFCFIKPVQMEIAMEMKKVKEMIAIHKYVEGNLVEFLNSMDISRFGFG